MNSTETTKPLTADVTQEEFEENWPYCTCDEDPMEDEGWCNQCHACGKPLS